MMIDNARLSAQEGGLPVALGLDYFGVLTLEDTRTELARSFGLSGQRGILIGGVVPGSPAANAGLRGAEQLLQHNGKWVQPDGTWVGFGGDLILALDGTPAYSEADVLGFLQRATPGRVVAVRVLRFKTSALRQAPAGLAQRSQEWLLHHYWRPMTVEVTLGAPTPVSWNW
jgi:S1-C subfamily serine protease